MSIDWPGLLKWSLNYADGTNQNNTSPRSAEDFAFLENAIKEALGNVEDPNKLVKESLPKLSGNEASETLSALTVIQECVDIHPEISRNLNKLGATRPLYECVKMDNMMISETALTILIFCLPNNEPVQLEFYFLGGLAYLFQRLRENVSYLTGDDDQRRFAFKLFSCLCAMVKSCDPVTKSFIESGGMQFAGEIASNTSADQRIRTKAENLIRFLIDSGDACTHTNEQ